MWKITWSWPAWVDPGQLALVPAPALRTDILDLSAWPKVRWRCSLNHQHPIWRDWGSEAGGMYS